MKNDKPQGAKLFHYLVAGNVVIDIDGNVQAIPQNAMVVTESVVLGKYQLGKAQQALQIALSTKLGEMPNIVDVVITNLIPLGRMTSEQFHNMPADVQERAPVAPGANVIDFTGALNGRS